MYKFINNVDKNEYEKFIENNKAGHFMQSIYFGEIRKEKKFTPYYVGVKEKDKLIAAALLLKKTVFGNYSYFYSPRGFVIDFNNYKLLEFFTKNIIEFAKNNKAFFIKLDPNIKLKEYDSHDNLINNNDNKNIFNNLKKLGYKHLGFNMGFEHEQPRFTYKLDINRDWNSIYSNMHSSTRKILNKGNYYDIDIKIGNIDNIDDFYITMVETSKRDGIIQAPINYYKSFYSVFNKENMSDLYISKVNIKNLKEKIIELINNNKNDLINIKNIKKNEQKILDKEKQIQKLKEDLDNLNKIKDKEVILSSIITVKYGDTVWTVHGGNNSKLLNLNANYLTYYQIIKDAYNNNYKYVDFFGTCGYLNPDKSNPIYGLHNFKKKLGGNFIELIGEFDLPINKILYYLYKVSTPIYRKTYRILKK